MSGEGNEGGGGSFGQALSEIVNSTGLPALVRQAEEFLAKLLGPATEEVGELLADRVRSARIKNQVTILLKAQEHFERAGLKPREIPLRTLAPLLEGASWEDEPVLQEMWASLLATAGSETGNSVPPAYPEILRQLSPADAQLLNDWFVKWGIPRFQATIRPGTAPSNEAMLGLANLRRLGIVEPPAFDDQRDYYKAIEQLWDREQQRETHRAPAPFPKFQGFPGPLPKLQIGHSGPTRLSTPTLTPLGYAFLLSCIRAPEPPREKGTIPDEVETREIGMYGYACTGFAERVKDSDPERAKRFAEHGEAVLRKAKDQGLGPFL